MAAEEFVQGIVSVVVEDGDAAAKIRTLVQQILGELQALGAAPTGKVGEQLVANIGRGLGTVDEMIAALLRLREVAATATPGAGQERGYATALRDVDVLIAKTEQLKAVQAGANPHIAAGQFQAASSVANERLTASQYGTATAQRDVDIAGRRLVESEKALSDAVVARAEVERSISAQEALVARRRQAVADIQEVAALHPSERTQLYLGQNIPGGNERQRQTELTEAEAELVNLRKLEAQLTGEMVPLLQREQEVAIQGLAAAERRAQINVEAAQTEAQIAAAEKERLAAERQATKQAAYDQPAALRSDLRQRAGAIDPLSVGDTDLQAKYAAAQRKLLTSIGSAPDEERLTALTGSVVGLKQQVENSVKREAAAAAKVAKETETQAAVQAEATRVAGDPRRQALLGSRQEILAAGGVADQTGPVRAQQLQAERALLDSKVAQNRAAANTVTTERELETLLAQRVKLELSILANEQQQRAAAAGNGGFIGGLRGTYGGHGGGGEGGSGFGNIAYQAGTATKYFALYAALSEGQKILRETITNTEQYTRGVADLAIAMGVSTHEADATATAYAKVGAALGAGPLESIDSAATFLRTYRTPTGGVDPAAGDVGARLGSRINILEGRQDIQPDLRSLVALSRAYDLGPKGAESLYDQATVVAQQYGFQGANKILPGAAAIGDLGKQSGYSTSQVLELIAGVSQQTGVSGDAAAGDIKRFLGAANSPALTGLFQQYGVDLSKTFRERLEDLSVKISPEALSRVLGTGGLGDARTTAAVVAALNSIPFGKTVEAKVAGSGADGAAEEQARRRLEGLAGSVNRFKTELEQLEVQIGRGGILQFATLLVKAGTEVVTTLTFVAEGFNGLNVVLRDIILGVGAYIGFLKARAALGAVTGTATAVVDNLAGRSRAAETSAEAAATARSTAATTTHVGALNAEAAAEARAAEAAGVNAAAQGAAGLAQAAGGWRSVVGGIRGFLTSAPGLITIFAGLTAWADEKKGVEAAKTATDDIASASGKLAAATATRDPAAIAEAIRGLTAAQKEFNRVPDTNLLTKLAFALNVNGINDKGGAPTGPPTAEFRRPATTAELAAGSGFFVTTFPTGGHAGKEADSDPRRLAARNSFQGINTSIDSNIASAQAVLAEVQRQADEINAAAAKGLARTQDLFGTKYDQVGNGLANIKNSGISPSAAAKILNDELDHISGNIEAINELFDSTTGKVNFAEVLGKLRSRAAGSTNPLDVQSQLGEIRQLSKKALARAQETNNVGHIDEAQQAVQADDKAYFDILAKNTQLKIESIKALQGDNARSRRQITNLVRAAINEAGAAGNVDAVIALLGGVDKAFLNAYTKTLNAQITALQQALAALKAAQKIASQVDAIIGGMLASANTAVVKRGEAADASSAYGEAGSVTSGAKATADRTRLAELQKILGTVKTATPLANFGGGDFNFPKDAAGSGPSAADVELARIQAQAQPGNAVQQARVALQAARYQLSTAKDQAAYWNAYKAVQDAKFALAQAEAGFASALLGANAVPGDPLSAATVAIRQARIALSATVRGTTDYFNALHSLREAQYTLGKLAVDMANNSDLLRIDISDPVAQAREQVRAAQRQLSFDRNRGALGDVITTDQVALRQAQSSAAGAAFNQQFQDAQTNYSLNRTSLTAYLSYLNSQHNYLSAVKNKTRQQVDELNQVDQALKSLTDSLQGQFNLGDIKVPTPYEVRRSLAVGASQASTVQAVNITVNGNDLSAMRNVLGEYFGPAITQTVASQPAKVN